MAHLLRGQQQGSPYRGLPVEEKNGSATLTTTSGETVAFYYSNSDVRTSDAGQAAGVVVEAVLAKNNIKNNSGKIQASVLDTSLSFTSTAFTTEVLMPLEMVEMADEMTWANRLAYLTADLTNGQYRVDYGKGIIYGKKASNQISLANATYKTFAAAASGGGVSATDNAVFTASSDPTTPAAGFVNTPGVNDVTTGRSGAFGMTTTRAMRVQLDTAPASATSIAKAEDAVSASGDVGVSVLAIRKDTPTNLVSADGDYAALEVDANGNVHTNLGTLISGEDQTNNLIGMKQKPVSTNTYSWDVQKSTAYEASRVVKTTSGVLREIIGYNSKTSAQFIQVHNASSLPADTAVPDLIFTVAASSNFFIDFSDTGYYCSTGIVVCNSSTGPTKTIGAADCWFDVLYK